MDANRADKFARRRIPKWLDAFPLPPSDAPREPRRPQDNILNDPASDLLIDFNSQEGFYQTAKKKKGKAAQPPPPPPPPSAPPADNGQQDDNGRGDGGANGGDAAGGAGGGGGGGNGNNGLPAISTNDFGTDSFQDIKLGDDKLDLGLKPPEGKGFDQWGTKWNSGGTGWDFSGGGGGNDIAGDGKDDENPWGKSKGLEGPPEGGEQEKEDPWGFGVKKEKKKSPLWGAEPEEEVKSGDGWGWGGSKKKGKGLEEVHMASEAAATEKKDIWDTWGISKKDRTKKKGILEDAGSSHAEPPPDLQDDLWGGGWSSKKPGGVPAPAPDPPSFEDKNEGDDFWATFGSGKSKPVEEKSAVDGWSSWGLTKKGKQMSSIGCARFTVTNGVQLSRSRQRTMAGTYGGQVRR